MNQLDIQKSKKARILTAISATGMGVIVLHFLSQLCNWLILSPILHTRYEVIGNYGWLIIRGTELQSLGNYALASLSLSSVITAVLLNEISVIIIRSSKEPMRTFFLFFQLAATTVVLFGVFLFLFAFAFEINLFTDWYLLAKQFHGRIEYKMLAAFFLAAATFSYCGTTLTRLKYNFALDTTEQAPLPPLQPKNAEQGHYKKTKNPGHGNSHPNNRHIKNNHQKNKS